MNRVHLARRTARGVSRARRAALAGAVGAIVAALGPAAAPSRAADVTSTWFGETGNWGNFQNWMNVPPGPAPQFPNNNPSTTYDAVITSGFVNLDLNITLQQLMFEGGTVQGPSNLTLVEGGRWSAGTMGGTGTTFINSGATFTVRTTGIKRIGARLLSNKGTVSWIDGSISNASSSPRIDNLAGGLFNVQGGTALALVPDSSGTFNNFGAFQKGTANTFTSQWLFNSSGTVDVQGGTLQLVGGGTGSGNFTVASGATLEFRNYTLTNAASVTGAGTVLFSGAVLNINGTYNVPGRTHFTAGTVNFNGLAVLGDLDVDSGTVNVPGRLTVTNLRNTGGALDIDGGTVRAESAFLSGGVTTVRGVGGELYAQALTISGGRIDVRPGGAILVGIDPTLRAARASGTAIDTANVVEEVLVFTGAASPAVNLSADPSTPGIIYLGADVVCNVPSGTARINSVGTPPLAGTVDLGGPRVFTVAEGTDPVDMEVSARIVNGSIRKSGPGTLRLTGASEYTAGTTVAGGSLEITHPNALGTGPVVIAGGTLGLRADAASAVYPFALSAAPADSITLNISRPSGEGTTAQVPSAALGTRLDVSGVGSTLVVSGPVTLQARTTVEHVAAVSFDGPVSGASGLTKAGAGTLTFGGAAANTYAGETTVNAGLLRLAKTGGATAVPGMLRVNGPGAVRLEANHQIGDTAAVVVNAVTGPASLDLNGRSETIGSLDNGGAVTTGAGALSVGPVTGTGTINVSAAGGSLAANYVRQASLTIAAGATAAVRPRSAGGATSVLQSLGIGGSTDAWTGRLDLADTAMILDHSGGNTSPLATVANQIKAGHAGGNWSGNGITSTSAAAGLSTALGYAESLQALGAGGGTFRGQPADGTAVLVRYTLFGDANLDGFVNGSDFALLAGNFGKTGQFWYGGDFNYDQSVNGSDFALLAGNFGRTAPGGGGISLSAGEWESLETFGASIGVPVPEPGAAALAALAAAGLLRRRRGISRAACRRTTP